MAKKTTAVTLRGKDVPDILSLLEKELKSLKAITETPYLTTGNLEGFGDIKNETKVENLIRAFSMVRGKEDAYHKAGRELGFDSYPGFSISGGNAEQWKQDIQLRVAIIQHDDRKKKLQEYKDRVSKFLSEEDQKTILLKEMASFLGKNAESEVISHIEEVK